MNTNLNGRVALVTGSSSGLGLEIAKVLAKNGAGIILCGRNGEKLEKVDLKARYHVVDATDVLSVRQMFLRTNSLDILVNNIGGAPKFGKFEDLTDRDWMHTFDLNVMTAVRFTREALPLLKKSPNGGKIINIASLPALQPGTFNPDYAACKAALVNFTKYLANEYGKDRICANVICPSTLFGDGLERNAEDVAVKEDINIDEARQKIIMGAMMKNPLNRMGFPSHVANLVAFLCSDEADFITGQCIAVDGGESRGI